MLSAVGPVTHVLVHIRSHYAARPLPLKRRRPQVTFVVDEDNLLSVSARDLDGDRHAEWMRGGGMVARLHSTDAQEVSGQLARQLAF